MKSHQLVCSLGRHCRPLVRRVIFVWLISGESQELLFGQLCPCPARYFLSFFIFKVWVVHELVGPTYCAQQ